MVNWQQESVLVTGGGGFLGSHIIDRLLEAGCKTIISAGRSPQPELAQKGVTVCRGDLRNSQFINDCCRDCSVVFHTAAKAGVWGSRDDFFSINVDGTDNVIKACREQRVKALVHTSSPSVAYPPTRHIENVTEDEPMPDQYLAFYPESKALAEKNVIAADSEQLATAALRPHLIWGPGDPHLLPRVLERARAGRLRIVGDGLSRVDLTYVENAAQAHINAAENLLTERTAAGNVFFISDGEPVKLWDWINSILTACDIRPVTGKISYRTAYQLGYVLEMVYKLLPFLGEPPMTRFVAGQLAFSHYFDITLAKSVLNYKPVISNEEALKRTVDWLKQAK